METKTPPVELRGEWKEFFPPHVDGTVPIARLTWQHGGQHLGLKHERGGWHWTLFREGTQTVHLVPFNEQDFRLGLPANWWHILNGVEQSPAMYSSTGWVGANALLPIADDIETEFVITRRR